MKRIHSMNESGITLIELMAALVIMALILISFPAAFRGGTHVWQASDRHAEVLQNALIGMEQITRELRQAKNVISVSASSDTTGYIEFKYAEDTDYDGVDDVYKYQLYAAIGGYLQYAWSHDGTVVLANSLDMIAGPVSSLTFTCYKFMDGSYMEIDTTDSDDIASIRLVEIQMYTYDSERVVNPIPLSSHVYLRGSVERITGGSHPPGPGGTPPETSGRADEYAIFGNYGVSLFGQPTYIGYYGTANVGGNGNIEIGNQITVNGETHAGSYGKIIYTGQPEQPVLGPTYDFDEYIMLPCPTQFTPGELVKIPQAQKNNPLDLVPGSYEALIMKNNSTVNLMSSGVYYIESLTAKNNNGMINNGVLNIYLTTGDVDPLSTERDIYIYIMDFINIGNNFTINIIDGTAANVYWEVQHQQIADNDPAVSFKNNITWRGTVYAPFGDIDIIDGVLEGQFVSGRHISVHGGSPSSTVPEPPVNETMIDFVLSNYMRYYGKYDCRLSP